MHPSSNADSELDGNSGYAVETISTQAELRGLEDDWNRLSEAGKSRNVFGTYGWYSAWSNYYGSQRPADQFCPEVLLFFRKGELAGIAPLVRSVTSRFGVQFRRLEFATIHADYNEPILGEDRLGLMQALAEHLARTSENWDSVDLRDVPDGREGAELVKTALTRAGLLYRATSERHSCPYLPLDGGAEDQIAKVSGHVRRVLRKRSVEAERENARVRLIEHPENEPGLLEAMIELERKKHLRSEFQPFLFSHENVFRELFKRLGPRNQLCVALLECANEPIAFQLSFRCGTALWDYNKAFDHAYYRLAPGTLLTLAMFDYGFAHGFDEYDFLRGEEEYKKLWSADIRTRSRILVWNKGMPSRLRKIVYYDLKAAVYRMMRRQDER